MWLDEFQAPSPHSINPTETIESRVQALLRELFGLYERSETAYQVYLKSPRHPILVKYENWWYENAGAMTLRALGERASEE